MSGTPEKNKANFSDLLAELAGEATAKTRALQVDEAERQARDEALHGALNKLFKFFNQFSHHLNQIKPAIPRVYGVAIQTVYDQLVWLDSFTDYRKQSMQDNALFDHVLLRIQLGNPAAVEIKRRWHQLDNLKGELHAAGLRSIDDLDMMLRDRSKKEFFHIQLAPDFQTRIHFQGNYDSGNIAVSCINLEDFGAVNFTLKPEEVSTTFMDELGLFLMARSNELPDAFQRTRQVPLQTIPR